MRLSLWMAMNGGTGMFGSLLSWGLGHIHGSINPYQVYSLRRGSTSITWLLIITSHVDYFPFHRSAHHSLLSNRVVCDKFSSITAIFELPLQLCAPGFSFKVQVPQSR